MLEIDAAGVAEATEGGIEIVRAPEGVTFAPLADHERLGPSSRPPTSSPPTMRLSGSTASSCRSRQESSWRSRSTSASGARRRGAHFWRLLVVAEKGSRFTLIEESASASTDLESYSNAVSEIFVEDGAKLEFVSIQNLSRETWHFATHRATVGRDAELDWVAGGFGSRKGKVTIENDLAGAGATSRVTGAYFADGEQHLDYDTLQAHLAPNTTSDFAFKGVLRDKATAVWRGMIKVAKDAQRTNAYQENRNLLLSPDAHADSIPGLEILANDVRCTHGATVSQVNRDELFYCMARGLSKEEAQLLIVRGFYQEIFDRIELEPVRDALQSVLEARLLAA